MTAAAFAYLLGGLMGFLLAGLLNNAGAADDQAALTLAQKRAAMLERDNADLAERLDRATRVRS